MRLQHKDRQISATKQQATSNLAPCYAIQPYWTAETWCAYISDATAGTQQSETQTGLSVLEMKPTWAAKCMTVSIFSVSRM